MNARKVVCQGTGRSSKIKGVYPSCPVCGRRFGHQGPNTSAFYPVPRHYINVEDRDRAFAARAARLAGDRTSRGKVPK